MIYTICNRIKELPDYPYEDGAKTIFLYTKGKLGNPSQELKELLSYMENSTEENASNKNLKDIHQMVNIVKQDEEVSTEYMKAFEHDEMIYQQGHESGIEQGRIQGIIETARRYHATNEEIIRQLIEELSISEEKAIASLTSYK